MARRISEEAARKVHPIVWFLAAAVLAFVVGAAGVSHLTGDIFEPTFDELGLPAGLYPATGVIELIAAVGLLWRPSRAHAGALVALLMVAALLMGLAAGVTDYLGANAILAVTAGFISWHTLDRPESLSEARRALASPRPARGHDTPTP